VQRIDWQSNGKYALNTDGGRNDGLRGIATSMANLGRMRKRAITSATRR
jgi:hypothetical protein